MKSNPFYALSALAMLLGCWLLSEALHLQAGQLGSLVLLIVVLQAYEGLLVALGTFLVRTRRAPRDGRVLLVIESVFLMDASLLASECVAADLRLGTAVALALAGLAWAKLGWVRRAAPDLLSTRAALLLGAHAALILGMPVVAAQLAQARVFGPGVMYGFWWLTLAAPLAQRMLRTEASARRDAPGGTALWSWTPAAMLLLHLWTVGYTHTIDFHPAFLAPLLVALAATAAPGAIVRQVVLPGLALLLSAGQGATLGFQLAGESGTFVSPARLAAFCAALAWAYLVWRDRDGRLVLYLVAVAPLGVLGPAGTARLVREVARWLDSATPRDPFGWGVLTVVAAFVLLGAGVRRSLQGEGR